MMKGRVANEWEAVGCRRDKRESRRVWLPIGNVRLAIDQFSATVDPSVENDEKSRKMPPQPTPKLCAEWYLSPLI